MAVILAAQPGPGIDMNQTTQQVQAAASTQPRVRKDWEWFWRIIAGLMLVFVAWAAWVLYQITPESVVTPLAYATRVRPIGTLQSENGTPAPAAAPVLVAPQPAPSTTEAAQALERAEAASRSGAHQSSIDIQAAAAEKKDAQLKGEGLRLATEISTPLSGAQGNTTLHEGKPVPAAGEAEKDGPKSRQ